MLDPRRFLTEKQLLQIPRRNLPLLVLSDNQRSWISTAIKRHEEGCYNHLMWMHEPGLLVSQGWTIKEEPIEKYLLTHRLKFWTCDDWSLQDRLTMRKYLLGLTRLPWYNRLYDPLQIVGKWTGLDWLQIPGNMRICSDHADLLGMVDLDWQSKRHLSPPEVNRELIKSGKYRVYGRYFLD